MGCDIHTFIEYSDFNNQNGEPCWNCFGGQLNQGRDYTLFGVLAGVRDDTYQLFEPRGLPAGRLSYQTEEYMRVRIADEGKEPAEGEVSLETARSWGEPITELNGKPRWVGDVDLHSHSWLTLDELKQALAHYTLGGKAAEVSDRVAEADQQVVTQAVAALQGYKARYEASWDATVAAMEALAARGCQTRLIFCFDN